MNCDMKKKKVEQQHTGGGEGRRAIAAASRRESREGMRYRRLRSARKAAGWKE